MTRRSRLYSGLGILLLTMAVLEASLRLVMGNADVADLIQTGLPDGRCTGLAPGAAIDYVGWLWRIPAVRQEVNGLGYRGPERPTEKSPDVFRVVALGDSFVYGMGVGSESTIPARLEERLKSEGGGGPEVLNFAVPGHNLPDIVDQFCYFAARWQPDLVLLFLSYNDLGPPGCTTFHRLKVPALLRRVYVCRLVAYLWLLRKQHREEVDADPSEVERRIREPLNTLFGATRAAGASLAVVLLGDLVPTWATKRIQDFLDEESIPWLYVATDAIDKIPREGHFSAEGNRHVADETVGWLSRRQLLRREVASPELDSPTRPSG